METLGSLDKELDLLWTLLEDGVREDWTGSLTLLEEFDLRNVSLSEARDSARVSDTRDARCSCIELCCSGEKLKSNFFLLEMGVVGQEVYPGNV